MSRLVLKENQLPSIERALKQLEGQYAPEQSSGRADQKSAQTNPQANKVSEAVASTEPVRPPAGEILNGEFDPDILEKLGGPQYTKKRWTLADSATLVRGAPSEPVLTTLSWIVLPTAIVALLLWAMACA